VKEMPSKTQTQLSTTAGDLEVTPSWNNRLANSIIDSKIGYLWETTKYHFTTLWLCSRSPYEM